MPVFGDYSDYYDLLYNEKDYRGEVEYVESLIEHYHPTNNKTLLVFSRKRVSNYGCRFVWKNA